MESRIDVNKAMKRLEQKLFELQKDRIQGLFPLSFEDQEMYCKALKIEMFTNVWLTASLTFGTYIQNSMVFYSSFNHILIFLPNPGIYSHSNSYF